MQTPYPLSTDYELLYQLVKLGFDIPCWFKGLNDVFLAKHLHQINRDPKKGPLVIPFVFDNSDTGEFIQICTEYNLEYIKPTLHVGEWIIANIIGEGIYEIVSFDDYHVRVKLKKMFLKGWTDAGHITCCHNRPEKINLAKWLGYKRVKRP